MAVARVGHGTVFAVGDPWFYNEYTDGRNLPPLYENYKAAVTWCSGCCDRRIDLKKRYAKMKKFLDENFLLGTDAARQLYHEYAKEMPVIDYHCHLSPQEIAADHRFANLTQAWLYGDHYKWRAMRTNGVEEGYCTGEKPDWEKFQKWAETVPYTLRNPLYHWTHLELQRYFEIDEILNGRTARKIYDECTEKLQTKEFSVRNLLAEDECADDLYDR